MSYATMNELEKGYQTIGDCNAAVNSVFSTCLLEGFRPWETVDGF